MTVEHFTYICSKAFVKIKFSVWPPIKFLYVYLKNKELLISSYMSNELFYMGKNCFSKLTIPQMRC